RRGEEIEQIGLASQEQRCLAGQSSGDRQQIRRVSPTIYQNRIVVLPDNQWNYGRIKRSPKPAWSGAPAEIPKENRVISSKRYVPLDIATKALIPIRHKPPIRAECDG